MSNWRLIECSPAAGAWNMAVDAALMESVAESRECCLRFYAWSEPTVSLGYFQTLASREGHAASRACPLVRRSTGGGAIVHDREITYSLVLPADHPLAVNAQGLYRLAHETLIEALSDWGLRARLCQGPPALPAAEEPFLCFARRADGDVLLGEAKIAGSAQRRRRGAVLQHGSVLLARSAAAPELSGIAEVGGRSVAGDELTAAWRQRLGARCAALWRPDPLRTWERERAVVVAEQIFSYAEWNSRR